MKKTILSLNRPTAAILAGTIAATLCFAADGKNEPRKKTPAAKAENKPGKEAEGLAKPVEPVKETPPSEGRKTEPSPKLRVTAPKVTSPDGTPTPAEPLPKSSLPLDPTGTDVQLYPPMPYLGPAIKMASALQSPIPEDERMYSVGRIFLAYKTNIRAKNAKLPTEAVLLETSVPLLQTSEGLFARPQESTLFAKKTDPALVRLKARTTAVAPQKQLGSIGKTKGSPVKEPEIKDAEPQEIDLRFLEGKRK